MTVSTHTGFPVGGQGAAAFTHTPVSRAFGALIADLRCHVEAERDLEHAGSWDLSCDAWLTDAEAAREAALAAVARVDALPVERAEDRVLRHAARLTGALIEADSALDFGHHHSRIEACALRFATGADPLSRRLALMMDVLSEVITSLRDLPDYADTIDAAPADVEANMAGPEDGGPFEIPADILDPPIVRAMPEPAAAPGLA